MTRGWMVSVTVLTIACGGERGADSSTTFATTLPTVTEGTETTTADESDDGVMKFDLPDNTDLTTGGDGECPCAPKADLIFVLSDSAELWSYDPLANQFQTLGTFDCGIAPTTFSMGVSRSAIAWVMYRPDGDIFHVDVNDANNCTDPGYSPGQAGFSLYGMAFASQSELSPCDKLYAHTFDDTDWSEGPGVGMLGRLEPSTLQLAKIADIDYNGGELTGTGDGRLFAFAGVPDAKLIEYDKATGQVVDTLPLTGLQLTFAFAFAFWGGDFYFFTESGLIGSNSKVTKLDFDGSDGNGQALTTVNPSAPLRVVGAGVSTCAPFLPPG